MFHHITSCHNTSHHSHGNNNIKTPLPSSPSLCASSVESLALETPGVFTCWANKEEKLPPSFKKIEYSSPCFWGAFIEAHSRCWTHGLDIQECGCFVNWANPSKLRFSVLVTSLCVLDVCPSFLIVSFKPSRWALERQNFPLPHANVTTIQKFHIDSRRRIDMVSHTALQSFKAWETRWI